MTEPRAFVEVPNRAGDPMLIDPASVVAVVPLYGQRRVGYLPSIEGTTIHLVGGLELHTSEGVIEVRELLLNA